jgi:predicted O-methyltransferase YrrM
MNNVIGLEDLNVLDALKAAYAFDDGAALWHNADKRSLGFGLLHYAFVRNLRPDFALAIGSRYGFIPACLALALKANGKGRLHFVDANYNDQTDHYAKAYGGSGHWSRPVEELFGALQLYEWIDLFIERTDAFFPRTAAQYGYIYIDGNHSYEGIEYDLAQAVQRLLPGGIVAMHDALVDASYGASMADPGVFGVRDYLSKHFPQAIVLGRWPGLAMIQTHWPAADPTPHAQPENNAHQQSGGKTAREELNGDLNQSSAISPQTDSRGVIDQRIQQLESVAAVASKEKEELRSQLIAQEEQIRSLAAEIYSLKGLEKDLKSAVAETREQLLRQDAYYELIARIRNLVRNKVPEDSTVLVVSKGDDQLVSFGNCQGWHFPQAETGVYSGTHPTDSAEAIARLEALRAKGGQYLLLPQTAMWWLDSYPEFKAHLLQRYAVLAFKDDTGLLVSLERPSSNGSKLY